MQQNYIPSEQVLAMQAKLITCEDATERPNILQRIHEIVDVERLLQGLPPVNSTLNKKSVKQSAGRKTHESEEVTSLSVGDLLEFNYKEYDASKKYQKGDKPILEQRSTFEFRGIIQVKANNATCNMLAAQATENIGSLRRGEIYTFKLERLADLKVIKDPSL